LKRLALTTAVVATAPLLALVSHADAPAYSVKPLTITTTVAPEGALGVTTCKVDADLYTPAGASKARPAPAILTTNGFGGSKSDQAGAAKWAASHGYVVLSYSGLGFGADPQTQRRGSDCKISLDDRAHDGAAAKQLVDFLGGIKAADDGTKVDYVVKDKVAHDGKVHAGDIRIGMVGGSYGGQIQFAAAAVDPRIDTIVPLITWNDLAYSLAPNNATLPANSVSYRVPGTEKIDWTTAFFALGIADGVQGAAMAQDPTRLGPCPNFLDDACKIKVTMDTLGYADDSAIAFARSASVGSYLSQIRIPTLLGQGQADTLFTLREAAATYAALKARHVPVKMMWQSWGHSGGQVAGEFDLANPMATYQGRIVIQWMDYWLKGVGAKPALDFSYYRDWVKGSVAQRYGTAPSYPIAGTTTLNASGTSLVTRRTGLATGSTTIGAPGQAPLSYSETSVFQEQLGFPVEDAPGATAVLSTGPLLRDVDVVGAPTARLQLSSPTANGASPSTMLVAFVKLYDVAPDGTVDLAHRLIAPIRVADLDKPVDVALPGIVHRFPKGHRMQLVVSLTDWAYKGNTVAQVVTLGTSQTSPTTLTLPGRIDLRAFPAS
jgi:ABC-2 type transport system ATP-binding protein